jgi:hypothetical protein
LSWTAALEALGGWRVDAAADAARATECTALLNISRQRAVAPDPAWTLVGQVRRPTEQDEVFSIYRR